MRVKLVVTAVPWVSSTFGGAGASKNLSNSEFISVWNISEARKGNLHYRVIRENNHKTYLWPWL